MHTREAYKRPRLRRTFNIILISCFAYLTWAILLALLVGGGWWLALIIGVTPTILILLLSELTGAYDIYNVQVVYTEEENDRADQGGLDQVP